MSALCGYLDEHRDAVEGDLHDLYGIDVSDVFRGSLSPRRALVFVERALNDPRSHLRAAVLGDPRWIGWTHTDDALADLVDLSTGTFTLIARVLGANPPEPVSFARPKAPPRADDTTRGVGTVQRQVREAVAPDLGSLDMTFFST